MVLELPLAAQVEEVVDEGGGRELRPQSNTEAATDRGPSEGE